MLMMERDASARATHLEAATRKFLVTTIERKQMSKTTNFKRIALVAVAALGMGVLSSAPSQALFSGTAGSVLTVTATGGTGTLTGSKSDSTTAGTVSVTGLALAASDSYTITSSIKSVPAGTTVGAAPALQFMWVDTATSTGATVLTGVRGSNALFAGAPDTVTARTTGALGSGATAFGGTFNQTTDSFTVVSATAGSINTYVGAKFYAFQESNTANARVAGTYTYTLIVTPNSTTSAGTAQTADITITIGALTSTATVASPASSTAFLSGTSGASADDANPTALATASNTPAEYLTVTLKNAAGTTSAAESVTITTNIGQVGTSTNRGRSVVLAYTAGGTVYNVYPDGTAGVATITISTPSVTFASKQVTFFAASAKTITSTVAHPQLLVGTNTGAVRATAVDASGLVWAGQAYIVASSATDAAIAGSTTPVACSWDAANLRHNCPVTGTSAGTAKFKVIDAATVALATATSNEVTVTVNSNAVASVKLSFDKASYAPNERMRIYVTPLDSKGVELPANTYTNLFATGGITANAGFSGATVDLTGVSITTSAASSSTTAAKAGSALYTVFAPAAGGTVTITATGGTSLPTAAQVAVTATATVTDSGAAALAAVTALATTVASLKTLITTLTDLVLKIQKKVKA